MGLLKTNIRQTNWDRGNIYYEVLDLALFAFSLNFPAASTYAGHTSHLVLISLWWKPGNWKVSLQVPFFFNLPIIEEEKMLSWLIAFITRHAWLVEIKITENESQYH